MCFPLNDMAECLDEPTALGGISPAVEARDSAVGDKKVGMAGDPVCGHTISLSTFPRVNHLHSVVQLVSLTSLQSVFD